MATTATVGKVYESIAAVMAELSVEGISKGRKNETQGYKFRGIDDVFNALSPILSKHKLCMLPRILTRDVTERLTKNGGALFYVTVEAEFDLISAEDGSKHTIRTFGEAMDSGDKATNKAMSAAYKYAALQAFAIPTEGDNDADAQTVEVAPKQEKPATLPKAKAREVYEEIVDALKTAETTETLVAQWKNWQPEIKSLPADWLKSLIEFSTDLKADLNSRRPAPKPDSDPFGFDQMEQAEPAH